MSLTSTALFFQQIGETAGKLIGALKGLEFLSETMATYWTSQSDNFIAVGGTMSVNEAMLPKVILELRISPQAIEDWEKTQEGFDSYVTVMTRIVNLFNFSTDAQPPTIQTITAAELSFELSAPTSIDAASIMNPT